MSLPHHDGLFYAVYSTSFRKLQQLAEDARTSVLQDQRQSYIL